MYTDICQRDLGIQTIKYLAYLALKFGMEDREAQASTTSGTI